MRAGKYLALLALVFWGGGLAWGQAAVPSPAAPPPAADQYRISIGDTLSIAVEGEEAFTRECQVNGAGTISYPKLGDITVAGLSCQELRARLDRGLRAYLRHPYVTVTVKQYGQTGMSVFVMGEVSKPGPYPLANGAGFMQALAAAGGLTEKASGELTLFKGRTGQSFTLRLADLSKPEALAPGVMLEPGDVLLVPRKEDARYAVLGEVPKQGMFEMPLQGEVRVLDAVQNAGLIAAPSTGGTSAGTRASDLLNDPTRAADLEHARLTRGAQDQPLNLAALLRGDTSQNLVLQSGDVITVPRRRMVQVYALGEVRTPGRVALPEDRATVLDLLSAAGGLTAGARPSQAKLVRLVDNKPETQPVNLGDLIGQGDLRQNQTLRDGDALFVPPQKNGEPAWRSALSALGVLLRLPW